RLVPVEEIAGFEVERAREENMSVGGGALVEREARAPDERRVLERQRDVVEGVEEHHALLGRHSSGERIGLERGGLRRELAPPRLGDAAIHVPEPKSAVIFDADARDPPRDVLLVLEPELPLFREHAVPEQPPVRCADPFRRALQVHAGDARAVLDPRPRRAWPGQHDGRRRDARPERDRGVHEWTQPDEAREWHEPARDDRSHDRRHDAGRIEHAAKVAQLLAVGGVHDGDRDLDERQPGRERTKDDLALEGVAVGPGLESDPIGRKWLSCWPWGGYMTAIGTSTSGNPAARERRTTSPSKA